MEERQTPPMKRTNLNITERQHETLTNEARTKGISLSELIRRILDEYLRKKGN